MMRMNLKNKTKEVLLHLFLSKGVGATTLVRIFEVMLARSDLSAESLYGFSAFDFEHVFALQAGMAKKCVEGLQDFFALEVELSKAEKNSINIVSLLDDDYPTLLKKINVPPPFLFCQGDTSILQKQLVLSVVGARKADAYGKQVLENILPGMVSSGWVIVSGGALGIDSFAHSITLASEGSTVVVLGSGLGHTYPESNKKLFSKVAQSKGCLVSIFPYDTLPEKFNFPVRNRVIAGLGLGCLVVQAAKESGSLITAKYALEENREVFAVPGPVTATLSQGCHELLRQGAVLVESCQDIFSAFEFYTDVSLDCLVQSPMSDKSAVNFDDLSAESSSERLNLEVFKFLAKPRTIQEILEVFKIEQKILLELLFDLELEGKVIRNFNGTWEKS